MNASLLALQALNGLQYGMILFLVAAGLTLVFGVMDFINLAHGVQFTLGAYLTASFVARFDNFALGLAAGLAAALALGVLLEITVFRILTRRSHLEQVLGTFGVILVVTDALRLVYGPAPRSLRMPEALAGAIPLMDGLMYPLWRLAIIAAGLVVALALWLLVAKTRVGMLVRAGSTDRETVSALGVDIERLFVLVFVFGALLAAFAGAMAGPLLSIEPTMGDNVLILAFVVIVIGGIGSIRGAFVAALLIGLVDTLGRAFATDVLKLVLSNATASAAGPAIASMLIYVLMALVLVARPAGLFGGNGSS
jgi:branched-chain amino acid transport system permease protein